MDKDIIGKKQVEWKGNICISNMDELVSLRTSEYKYAFPNGIDYSDFNEIRNNHDSISAHNLFGKETVLHIDTLLKGDGYLLVEFNPDHDVLRLEGELSIELEYGTWDDLSEQEQENIIYEMADGNKKGITLVDITLNDLIADAQDRTKAGSNNRKKEPEMIIET